MWRLVLGQYGSTRTMCEISSKLTVKTLERHQWPQNFYNIWKLPYTGISLEAWGINSKIWTGFL